MRIQWLSAGVIALASCLPTGSDATQAGTFTVAEQMTTNACGPQATTFATTAQFQVVLGTSPTDATWQPAGQSPVSGQFTTTGRSFLFTTSSSTMLRDAVLATGQAACVMVETDQISGSLFGGPLPSLLDASMSDSAGWDVALVHATGFDGGVLVNPDAGTPAFSATETFVFGPSSTSDCSDFVGANQGQFLTLPCQIIYTLNGTM